jgi:hypothetical protein
MSSSTNADFFPMKVIIAGSRGINMGMSQIDDIVSLSGFDVGEVVSGGARGIDLCGETWATFKGLPIKRFPAIWRDRDGSRNMNAGRLRNSEMARYADALIAIWDCHSTGTAHMIDQANYYGLAPFIYVYDARPGAVNKPKRYPFE